ncbi:MAG: BREX-3 system P-loop-containing protein BrxF [Lentisphaeria bacterium]|nr:BREX-3 system P-loop-containing protein BrxF [Lentisphaeria bacterium]
MDAALIDKILATVELAKKQYYQLVLLVGSSGSGKTRALQAIGQRSGASSINLSLELSQRMLELSEGQCTAQLPELLDDIISRQDGDLLLLDNIELLFQPSLKHDPLYRLQQLSRNKTLLAAWSGEIRGAQAQGSPRHLYYASAAHPEYRRYKVQDFLALSLPA